MHAEQQESRMDKEPRFIHTQQAVTKRKPTRFSAAKAVKANARERVGQPKPVRVLGDKPRDGRQAKHKPKLQDVLQQEE